MWLNLGSTWESPIGLWSWSSFLLNFVDMELFPPVVTDIDVLSHAVDNESTVDALDPT